MRLQTALTAALLLASALPRTFAAPVYLGALSYNQLIPGTPTDPGVNAFDIQNLTGAFALPPDLPVVSDVVFTSAVLELYQGATLVNTISLGDIVPGPLLNAFGDIFAQVPGDLTFSSARFLATLSLTTLALDGGGTVTVLPGIHVTLLPSSGPNLNLGDTIAISVETDTAAPVPEPGSLSMLLAGVGICAFAAAKHRRTAPLAAFILALSLQPANAQNVLTLAPTPTPSAGLPGITLMSITASGFPGGTIAPSTVVVTLRPVSTGPAMTANAVSLALVAGSTCRVNFTFHGPNVTTPTLYDITIAGPGFSSRNGARLTVNPAPTIVVTPASATVGSSVRVTLIGQATSFVNGSARANFGPGISVNGSPAGATAPLTVSSPTTATAQLTIAASAPRGPRTITTFMGTLQVASNFTVSDPSNNAPTITSTPVATARLQQPYTYNVTATDPDNDPLTFSLNAPPTGMSIHPTSGVISWTPLAAGNFNVTIRAADNRGGVATQSYSVNVAGVTTTEPLLKFSFTDRPRGGAVLSPVVVDLDRDGAADIVFGSIGPSLLALYALDGRTGGVKWRIDGNYSLYASDTEMTTGDLDGDGFPEILVIVHDGVNPRRRIRCYNHDGTVKWLSGDIVDNTRITQTTGPYRLILANITGDSRPEIVFAHTGRTNDMLPNEFAERLVTVFNNVGQHVSTTRLGRFNGGWHTVTVADIDIDGNPEILEGGAAVNNQGVRVWREATSAQMFDVAVANLDSDSFAELVYIDRFSNLYCLEHTGALKWGPIPVPTSGTLAGTSYPVIGDADGDGTPEILIAQGTFIRVFNRDGSLQRSIPIGFEGAGGNPTIFDLNGDGRPEIIYHSARGPFDVPLTGVFGALFIFDGVSGNELHRIAASRTSNAAQLTPVIADVDGDGGAEIIVGGADQGGLLRVFKPASGLWSPARPIANQQEYSVTNVNNDGTIPAAPVPNWLTPGLNNFRVYSLPRP